jgi:L-alanine-DL-glutamate epimerase-like enolase superfamily enzyme
MGVEMALWDIVGKAVGKPVYALHGGKVHERLRSFTYLYPDEPGSHAHSDSPVYSNPDDAAIRALKYMAQGFTAVKFDSAGPYSTFDPRQPSFERLESIERWGGFHAQILKKPICWEDGYVIPPEEPGLGVELNEEVALAHPWTGTDCISCQERRRCYRPTKRLPASTTAPHAWAQPQFYRHALMISVCYDPV